MHPPTMAATAIPRLPWCLTPGAATCIHQSTNMLGDCFMRRRQMWGTMAADVDHLLGPNASTDVVGFCDVCFAREISYTPTNHGGRLPSRCLGSLHAEYVASSRPPIRNIMAS